MTQNLGFIKMIHVGTSAPTNTQMVWYNTNTSKHYYYDTGDSTWKLFTTPSQSINFDLVAGDNTITHTLGKAPDIIQFWMGRVLLVAGFQVTISAGSPNSEFNVNAADDTPGITIKLIAF